MIIVGIDIPGEKQFTTDDGEVINYNNVYVYAESSGSDKRKTGENYGKSTAVYKIKYTDFADAFPKMKPAEILGVNVVPYYNEYQKIIGFVTIR